MLRKCFSQPPVSAPELIYKQNLCSLNSLPCQPGRGGCWRGGGGGEEGAGGSCGAGGAEAAVPGRTGFIYCLWPGAGAAPGLHKFSGRALPLLPHPQCRLHPRGLSPRSPAPDSGGARRWFGGVGGEVVRTPRRPASSSIPNPPLHPWVKRVEVATSALGEERGWSCLP